MYKANNWQFEKVNQSKARVYKSQVSFIDKMLIDEMALCKNFIYLIPLINSKDKRQDIADMIAGTGMQLMQDIAAR